MDLASISQFVEDSLKFIKRKDNDEAIQLLVFMGLSKYSEILSDSTGPCNIKMELLREIAGDMKPLTISKQQRACSHDLRQSRGDVTHHYPFADMNGNVSEIMHHSSEALKLLEMGEPARKRVCDNIYNEFKVGTAGIRLKDIPEAFELLGLGTTPELALSLRNCGNADGRSQAMMNRQQWNSLIKRTVIKKIQASICQASKPKAAATSGAAQGPLTDTRTLAHTAADQLESSLQSLSSTDIISPSHSTSSFDRGSHQLLQEQQQQRQQQQQQPLRRRHPQSRIKEEVQVDRNSWQHQQEQQRRAAVLALAKRRVSALGSGVADCNWQLPTHTFKAKQGSLHHHDHGETVNRDSDSHRHSAGVVNPNSGGRGRVEGSSISEYSPTVRYNQLKQPNWLSTGCASLEIADSFLHSALGQELASMPPAYDDDNNDNDDLAAHTRDDYDYGVRPAEKQSHLIVKPYDNNNSSFLLSQRAQQKVSRSKTGLGLKQAPADRPPASSSTTTTAGATADGWQSARGGWVADFGPAHTRRETSRSSLGQARTSNHSKADLDMRNNDIMEDFTHAGYGDINELLENYRVDDSGDLPDDMLMQAAMNLQHPDNDFPESSSHDDDGDIHHFHGTFKEASAKVSSASPSADVLLASLQSSMSLKHATTSNLFR